VARAEPDHRAAASRLVLGLLRADRAGLDSAAVGRWLADLQVEKQQVR
jgi:hypothetical protein